MSETLYGQLAQTGVLGAILAWFMLRLENILSENTKAINALSVAIAKLCDQNG